MLKKQLILHLRVADNPKFGKRLYMTPFSYDTLMSIRITLAPVVGDHVFQLNYFEVLEEFKSYCLFFFPVLYRMRVDGIEDLRFTM